MLPLEASELLRLAVLSSVLGFAGFCISYSAYVWRKRNAANRRPRPATIRIAQIAALLGGALVALSWAFNEFQGRSGIAGANDLFVVQARREISADQITANDTVARGDIVATFLSPADRTRIAGVEMQKAQAEAKRDAIRNKVLQTDEALLQEQGHLQTELLQLKGFAFQLRSGRREVERDRASLLTDWTREESKLEEDAESAAQEYSIGASRLEISKRALQRALELQRQGHVSQQDLDTRNADYLTAELAVTKHKENASALQQRRAALADRIQASLAALDQQISESSADAERTQLAIVDVERKLKDVDATLNQDRARAVVSRDREVEAVQYDITILAAEKTRLTELGQVRAPFAGRVVYRHPAPGLATEGTPILAISAGTGFTATIKMPRAELPELAASREPVQLALDSPVLNNFFTGRFVRSEPVPYEPNRAIASFDCSLPPEIISHLASASGPVRVRLLWRPALARQAGFQVGFALLALGLLILAFGLRREALGWWHRRVAGPSPLTTVSEAPVAIRVARATDRLPAQPVSRETELRSLAAAFCRQLRKDQIRPELLAEVDRAFDPADPHAVRIFGEEIGRDGETPALAAAWMGGQNDRIRGRLAMVLAATARSSASGSARAS
jgi:hypothetical protein